MQAAFKTVHAHMVESAPHPSRWRPFRVGCTTGPAPSGGLESFYVKVRPNRLDAARDAAAAQISEVIGLCLAAEMGLGVHQGAYVAVSDSFAGTVNGMRGYPQVAEGTHFGTLWLDDVVAGREASIRSYGRPADLVRLWVLDSWLRVLDRVGRSEGNFLFLYQGGQFELIASDQSDCFDGAERFTREHLSELRNDASWLPAYPLVQQCIIDSPECSQLASVIKSVHFAAANLPAILGAVPEDWWRDAALGPDEVDGCLRARAERLTHICRLTHFRDLQKGLADADQSGGKLFDV